MSWPRPRRKVAGREREREGGIRRERKHRRQEWRHHSSSFRPDGATRRLPSRGNCDPLRGYGCPSSTVDGRRGKASVHLWQDSPSSQTDRSISPRCRRRAKLLLLGLLLQNFFSFTVSIESFKKEETQCRSRTSSTLEASGARERLLYHSERGTR